MHDFYYSRLLNDPTKFRPRDGNKYVEFFENSTGEYQYVEDPIDEAELSSWLSKSISISSGIANVETSARSSLKLFIGSPEEHHSDAKILPLPISRDAFEAVRTTWNMPTELLRMMLSSLPLAVPFTTTDDADDLLTGLMVRGARSRDWSFCLSLVHSPAKRSTVGILLGMQASEIQTLLDCLRQSQELIADPMLVPIFLLELRVHYFAVLLEKRALGIEGIEYDTGMRHGFSQDPQRNRRIENESRDKLRALDFHSITQKLTGVSGTLSFCDMAFETSRRALDVVTALRAGLENQTSNRTSTPLQPSPRPTPTTTTIDSRIAYLSTLISGSQSLCIVLSARTKAQVQTVYSLIGQRDNSITKDIAATSLQHNSAMKLLAEDSHNIAVLTRRDSTDMRIIAAVTLSFLPGTFLATVFGSNLFQFIPGGSGDVVSKWIWLYFVLTLVTTVGVLGAWWAVSKKQVAKTEVESLGVSRSADHYFRQESAVAASGTATATLSPESSAITSTGSIVAGRGRSLSKDASTDTTSSGIEPCAAVYASP
jgi:hypothetical protein